MHYPTIVPAYFIKRVNRFIATCRLEDLTEVVVHVKNTGRGKEVLLPGAEVGLSYQPAPTRKTKYDLVSVKKGSFWINIDSQIPNTIVAEGIKEGQILLPELTGAPTLLKREVVYQHSKFDIYVETPQEKAFVEVKGLTLENLGIGAFPDAPTLRGLKHVHELRQAQREGYRCYVVFLIQFEPVKVATIHKAMQPALWEEIKAAQADGVTILAYNCHVERGAITLLQQIPFAVDQAFQDPN